MSVQSALAFIAEARRDPALQSRLLALGVAAVEDDLVNLGVLVGYSFNADELQRAFRYDWVMRRVRYGMVGELDRAAS
jgi:hypothetical protein